MPEEPFKNQFDLLWNRVRDRALGKERFPASEDLPSSYDLAQNEIHQETLKHLRRRFEREKNYWETQISSKEEQVKRLQQELSDSQIKNRDLQEKIQALQDAQSLLMQRTLETVEVHKQSLQFQLEQLRNDLAETRQQKLSLEWALQQEREESERLRKEWADREAVWLDQKEKAENELELARQQSLSGRQKDLDEISRYEIQVNQLKLEIREQKERGETEKSQIAALLKESEETCRRLQEEVAQLHQQIERERDERKMAVFERERQAAQIEEDKKRLVEQLLAKENKLREVQDSLERILQEKRSLEEKQKELDAQEKILIQRREGWVESVRTQAEQQLTISDRIVHILERAQPQPANPEKSLPGSPAPFTRMPTAPYPQKPVPAGPPRPSFLERWAQSNSRIASFFGNRWLALKNRVGSRRWMVLTAAGIGLFLLTSALFLFQSQWRRAFRAQQNLSRANEYYTRNDLPRALEFLEKAYGLDPENSIIRNSYTLVLAESAHKDFSERKLDEALKQTERLYQMLPEDPDVVQLHTDIMQALGKTPKDPPPSR